MQTLNVGAGRTDEEHKATEEQRRADLRSDCRDDANYFFWAAGLSALGTGLLPVRLNLLVSIGTVDLLTLYGRSLGPFYPLAVFSLAAMWLLVMLGLGFAGRSGHRWAFGRDRYLCRRHDRSHSHIFIVGIRDPCILRVQMVPRTKSAERSQRSGRLDHLKPRKWAFIVPVAIKLTSLLA